MSTGEQDARVGQHHWVRQDDFEIPGVPDSFQRLWTPHRLAYVRGEDTSVETVPGCPFCTGPERRDDESLIAFRGEHCFVILNLFPYNPGHLLVCPYRHVADLTELTDDELRGVDTRLTPEVREVLTIDGAVASRSTRGGTARARVEEQRERVDAAARAHREWASTPVRGES